MIETVALSALIAGALSIIRSHARLISGVWAQARWYERAALCLALAPIPGPVDELLGVLVIRRVIARRGADS